MKIKVNSLFCVADALLSHIYQGKHLMSVL